MLNNGRLPKKKTKWKTIRKGSENKSISEQEWNWTENKIEQKHVRFAVLCRSSFCIYIFSFSWNIVACVLLFLFQFFVFVFSFERDVWKEINVLKWVDENKRKKNRIKKNTLHILVNSLVEIFQCWCMPLNTGKNDVKRI